MKAALCLPLTLALLLPACKSAPQPSSERSATSIPALLEKGVHVSKSPRADINEDEADGMLNDASTILKMSDGGGDIACDLTLTRDGNISTFDIGTGAVDTEFDFRRVCAQPGLIHVVERIGWCNGFLPNTWGCSQDQGPPCMVVVRLFDAELEAVLWAHEYGHTRGLPDRGGDNVVMDGTIEALHRRVDQTECDAYLEFGQSNFAPQAIPQPASVRDFVHQRFIHGVPYQQAQQYGSQGDVQTLVSMLQDPAEEAYWPNIAVTLGMVGDEEAARNLTGFIQRGEGVLSQQAYRAKTGALVALGYVLAHHNLPNIVKYLVTGTKPGSWRSLNWVDPFTRNDESRNLQLATNSLMALGMSGNQRALEALRRIDASRTFIRDENIPRLNDVLQEALKENQKALSQGIGVYTLKQSTATP